MNSQIKQIAERIKGLRESLDMTFEQLAKISNKTASEVEKYESGEVDIPMSFLFDISQNLGVDTSTLISGDEPKMRTYYITRKGKGASVERTKAYKYQSLAGGFMKPKVAPFEVTVEPNDRDIYHNTHKGYEFDYVLEGKLLIEINGKDLILDEGDSIFYDSSYPHGMKAMDKKKVKFLAIIM